MTRDELLERRRVLLKLYADPESDVQAVEVARELDANTQALRDLPRPPKPLPPGSSRGRRTAHPKKKPSSGRAYGWSSRSRDYAAGRD